MSQMDLQIQQGLSSTVYHHKKQVVFLPLTISSNNTPKLKTSDFSEKKPCIAYSGDIYPLHLNIETHPHHLTI